jgi:hypothetical protein
MTVFAPARKYSPIGTRFFSFSGISFRKSENQSMIRRPRREIPRKMEFFGKIFSTFGIAVLQVVPWGLQKFPTGT